MPTDTLAWNFDGVHDVVPLLWQVSQFAMATPLSVWYGMCVAERPRAGGYEPLWQLTQLLVTVTWVWFQLVGFQLLVLWQLMQLVAATGMCVPDLPVAVLPLWQFAQFVADVNPL